MKINKAIELITAAIPGAPFDDTVDVIKTGDASQEITSVVVTFMATVEVIETAISLGANFIITHEPIFYNHLDKTEWLEHDPVYQAKRKLIDEHKLVIWRFHDYLHSIPPDNTVIGMVSQMGWNKFASAEEPYLCTIPPVSLQELVSQVKNDFHLQNIRLAGDPSMICKKVALLPGAPGGEWQINALGQPDVDVLIAGEINEWEVNEYVRDATQLGISKGLIVIGHASSEEEGIRRMLPWLQEHLPGITLHFAPTSQALHSL